MKEITLKIQGDRIIIESPYDADLVENIKVLDWKQRKYEGGKWVCFLNDPDQQPDQRTNLQYLRDICAECAETRGWTFLDYSAKTQEQITYEKAEANRVSHEAHVQAFLTVLTKLPARSLKLIRWYDKTLKIQLEQYLGEDSYDLFMELKRASLNAYKPIMLANFDYKMTRGFVFEIANDPLLVRALLAFGTIYLKDRSNLKLTQKFEDHTAHFEDESGAKWVGIPVLEVDLSHNNFDSQSWEICDIGEALYAVTHAKEFIDSWMGQRSWNAVGFGGAFAVCTAATAELPKFVEDLHLQDWFEDYANNLLNSETLKGTNRGMVRKPWEYQHPADRLITYYKNFGDRSGLNKEQMESAIARIDALKQATAEADTKAAIANAKAKAIDTINLDGYTKPELVELANKYSFAIKKSAAKPVIVAAIVSQLTQEIAENILGLDKL